MIDKKLIIIDTDPGHDDALAILLLEKSGFFDVKAITTVAGNSTIQNTTNNARYVLDLIKSSTPIFSGAEKPIKRELIKAVVHGEGGLAGAEITRQEKLTGNASDKIIEIVRNNPNKISILAIAPETNIAEAFIKDPELPSLVKGIVIMGGAISVPGNKNRVGEFNIFVDPDAADTIFNADVKKILIPLDICNEVFFSIKDFDKLRNSPLYLPIRNMMGPYIEGIQTFEKTSGALMYDPLAAYYLINSKAFKTVPMDIQIEIQSELTRGMTVVDKRTWGDKKYNIDVAVSIDKKAFGRDFFSILNK
jgi:inosine-uridine nucleoside N-ribohydrolase